MKQTRESEKNDWNFFFNVFDFTIVEVSNKGKKKRIFYFTIFKLDLSNKNIKKTTDLWTIVTHMYTLNKYREKHDRKNTTMTRTHHNKSISLTHAKGKEKLNFSNMKTHTFMVTLW
jgi:hypothetical protein